MLYNEIECPVSFKHKCNKYLWKDNLFWLFCKVQRQVDRTLNDVEDSVKKHQTKAKRWYSSFIGSSDSNMKDVQVFLIAFCAGTALGMATSALK